MKIFLIHTIGAFAAAWKAVDLAEFLMNAGGVVGIINKLKKAIEACTVAKLKDKIETIQLCAMYAKDFVKSVGQTIAKLSSSAVAWVSNTAVKVADTTATVAHTAATWLATAATTAFGVAMTVLTSPITLVIAALVALGVGIYELVKHWDVVKEAAGICWDWIVGKWNSAGEWFAGVWENIRSAFSSFDNWLQNIFNIDFSDSFGFIGDIMNALFIDKKVDDANYNETAINELTGEQTQLLTARYSLRYDELIADLIATVQSLNNRLKALEQ